MDIVTQGLAGAVLAQSVAKPEETKKAMVIGFLAGLLADIDALFTGAATDPLMQLEFHRHFTHALLFIPVGGLIAAAVLWPFFRNSFAFKRLLLFTTLAYGTSGLIDACTSYGTHLFWPFSDVRTAWNIISILDPLFSFALIAAIAMATIKRTPKYAIFGLCFALTYLAVGTVQHQRAEALAVELAQSRGHAIERIQIKPTMGNLLLWRSVYETDGEFHIDAFRVAMLGENQTFPGDSVKRFSAAGLPQLDTASTTAEDIRRFDAFSDGYTSLHIDPHRGDDKLIIGDTRYSMVPTSSRPIWGIELDLSNQQAHTPFNQYHDASDDSRQLFIGMVLGNAEKVAEIQSRRNQQAATTPDKSPKS